MEEPSSKRRKIRKGTTSCWECKPQTCHAIPGRQDTLLNLDCVLGKRRKIRCQFASSSTEVCIGCDRRGTPCVTQDHDDSGAEQHAASKHRETEERLRRAEGLLEKMIEAASRLTPTTEAVTPGFRREGPIVERGSEPPRTRPVPETDGQWSARPMSPSPSARSCPSIQVFESTLVCRLEFVTHPWLTACPG